MAALAVVMSWMGLHHQRWLLFMLACWTCSDVAPSRVRRGSSGRSYALLQTKGIYTREVSERHCSTVTSIRICRTLLAITGGASALVGGCSSWGG